MKHQIYPRLVLISVWSSSIADSGRISWNLKVKISREKKINHRKPEILPESAMDELQNLMGTKVGHVCLIIYVQTWGSGLKHVFHTYVSLTVQCTVYILCLNLPPVPTMTIIHGSWAVHKLRCQITRCFDSASYSFDDVVYERPLMS